MHLSPMAQVIIVLVGVAALILLILIRRSEQKRSTPTPEQWLERKRRDLLNASRHCANEFEKLVSEPGFRPEDRGDDAIRVHYRQYEKGAEVVVTHGGLQPILKIRFSTDSGADIVATFGLDGAITRHGVTEADMITLQWVDYVRRNYEFAEMLYAGEGP